MAPYPGILGLCAALAGLTAFGPAPAGELVLKLRNDAGVTFVGAVQRWDADGNPRRPVNPKAKIDRPEVTAEARRRDAHTWVFAKLPPGRYDLVILAKDRVRVEGFHYPPVREFDPLLPPTARGPDDETRAMILKHIAKGKHYENKVDALFLAGDGKEVRALVQLVRDQPTSYDAEVGFAVATVRHEVWQYSYRYGAWTREKATKILDRVLLPRAEFRRWTWAWEPRLGGIEVRDGAAAVVEYDFPGRFDPNSGRGWFPE